MEISGLSECRALTKESDTYTTNCVDEKQRPCTRKTSRTMMTPLMARGQCLGGENTRAAYPASALAQTGPPLPIPGRALQDAGRNEIIKIKHQLYFKMCFYASNDILVTVKRVRCGCPRGD